jgi:hypothetical protein
MVEKRNVYRILERKAEGKRLLQRPRRRWECNIKIHLNETGWEGVECISVTQDRNKWWAIVNTVMNLLVP